jgi:hypothetical protein
MVDLAHRQDLGAEPENRSLRQRVGGDIETVGVDPVPEKQRTMTPGKLFIVWLMASASATTPLIGLLLFHYGLTYLIAAIVVAWVIGFVPAGLFSEMGRQVPLSALVVSRKTFGWDGSLLFSALFSVVNLGWFGLNRDVGGVHPVVNNTLILVPLGRGHRRGPGRPGPFRDEVVGAFLPVHDRHTHRLLTGAHAARRAGDQCNCSLKNGRHDGIVLKSVRGFTGRDRAVLECADARSEPPVKAPDVPICVARRRHLP